MTMNILFLAYNLRFSNTNLRFFTSKFCSVVSETAVFETLWFVPRSPQQPSVGGCIKTRLTIIVLQLGVYIGF